MSSPVQVAPRGSCPAPAGTRRSPCCRCSPCGWWSSCWRRGRRTSCEEVILTVRLRKTTCIHYWQVCFHLSMPIPSPSRSVNFSTSTCLSVFHLYLKINNNTHQSYRSTNTCCNLTNITLLCDCVPVPLVLGVVQVRVRTSVQAAVVQLSSAPVNPAWLHVTMGCVYALETKLYIIHVSRQYSAQSFTWLIPGTSGYVYILETKFYIHK